MRNMNGQFKAGDVVLGNWTLVQKIGEGSFGKVFEAHRQDFGVTYRSAIKIVTIPQNKSEITNAKAEGMDDASVTTYFKSVVENIVQEFALMSKLKGTANIVSYEDHSVVPHEGEIGWDIIIRMEFLKPLINHIAESTMTRRDIITLGIDMCKALELCQKYNIIHRDIKPENIFISENGDYKLGDFGIARTIEQTSGGLSKKGTYSYMAPEVYREDAYGSTVDIYSLGIVLYRLLNNNRTPFLPSFPAPIKHSDRERALIKRISGAKIGNPANDSGRLAEIVLKACAYEPKDRYSSPLQMRQELESILLTEKEEKELHKFAEGTIVVGKNLQNRKEREYPVNENISGAAGDVDGEKDSESTVLNQKKPAENSQQIPEEKSRIKSKKKALKSSLRIASFLVCLAIVAGYFIEEAQVKVHGRQEQNGSLGVETTELTSQRPASKLVDISTASNYALFLMPDGSVEIAGKDTYVQNMPQWKDMVAVYAGSNHAVGVKSDGTVLAADLIGNQSNHEALNVSEWRDIIAVAAGDYHTVGLKNDGTVVAIGINNNGQCDVSDWKDIVAVSAGQSYTIGFKSNGTTIHTGKFAYDVEWEKIIAVDSGAYHTVGLKKNGSVLATGYNEYRQCNVSDWQDIVAVAAGDYHTVGLKNDGTVVAVGINEKEHGPFSVLHHYGAGVCEVSGWRDIVAVGAGNMYTFGLKTDGTIVYVGLPAYEDSFRKVSVAIQAINVSN